MADDAKKSTYMLDMFAQAVTSCMDTKPEKTRFWLTSAFRAKRFQTRHFPDKNSPKSAQMAFQVALETVTAAMECPNQSVLTNVFLPSEIFLSMQIRPVIAEAIACFIEGARAEDAFVKAAELKGVSPTFCSYHKVLMGSALSDVMEPARLIANSSLACDVNNITFKTLAEKWSVPHVYIDVPYSINDDSIHYVADQFRYLSETTQDLFDKSLDLEVLKAHVARSQQTLVNLDRSLAMRSERDYKMSMIDLFSNLLPMHLSLGDETTLAISKQIIEELSVAPKTDKLSLLWVHVTPWGSVALQNTLDENPDVQLLASEMVFDTIQPEGFSYTADKPFEAMAERLLKNSFNGPADRRIQRIKYIAETIHADGIVVFCHWGCKETLGAAQLMKTQLESDGFPTLILDGDACHRKNMSQGQAGTRTEAYIEMLLQHKGDLYE